MAKKCLGCGIELQTTNVKLPGYIFDINTDYCTRCFRLKHYGEYKSEVTINFDMKNIKNKKDLVIYVIDIINLTEKLLDIKNPKILVINKTDLLTNINKEHLIQKFKKIYPNFLDYILVSANTNFNLDKLIEKIKEYKTSKNVYIVGNSNVGKSSLINKLVSCYSKNLSTLTISPLPGTTVGNIKLNLEEDLVLIDTPGYISNGNILNYVDLKDMKKLNSKKAYKPKTYQLKENQTIILDDYMRLDYISGEKNSFTIYTSLNVKIERFSFLKSNRCKNYYSYEVEIPDNSDFVIPGLGFIKIRDKAKVKVYINVNVKAFVRESIL